MYAMNVVFGVFCAVLYTDAKRIYDDATETCQICLCNNDTFLVNCSYTQLEHIPRNPSPKTKTLNMSHTLLQKVNDTDLTGYENLQVLDLSGSLLLSISTNAFKNLPSLTLLDLSNNEGLPLTKNTLSLDLFKPLQNLKELKLYGTIGTYNSDDYPDTALQNIPNLEILWTDGFTNQSFGPAFAKMKNLKSIRIPGDIIMPPWRFCDTNIKNGMLDYLIHVTNFTMRKCGIKLIESNAFDKMVSLVQLDLSYNMYLKVIGISQALASLSNTKLEVLIINSIENVALMDCGVTITVEMARNLSKISTLKEIHIEYNALNGLQQKAMQLLPKSIEYINARRNEFEIGFYAIEAFTMNNLRYADFSFNFFPDDTAIWHQESVTLRNTRGELSSCLRNETSNKQTDVFISEPVHDNEMTSLLDYIPTLKMPKSNADFGEHLATFLTHNEASNLYKNVGHHENSSISVCPRASTLIPPGTIIFYIPKNLEYLDLSHSKYAHPIPYLEVHEDNSLKTINASHSLLYCWEGPVKGLKNLEYLDLSLNLCQNINPSFFDYAPNLKYLSIAINLLQINIKNDIDGRILRNLTKLEELDMSFNRLVEIPKMFLIHQVKLRALTVSGNLLTNFSVEISHMENLTRLDLSRNHLPMLTKEVRDALTMISEKQFKNSQKTFQLNMTSNPIQCYCNNLEFLQWVHEHMDTCRFLNVVITECYWYDGTLKQITSRTTLGDILNRLQSKCKSYTNIIIGVVVALCVILNVIIAVVVHRFRWKIRYWYYLASSRHIISRNGYIPIDSLASIGSRYKYDIYVISANEDRNFVLGPNGLKCRLEEANFKLFIQDDDVLPGQNLYSVIINAVHVSRVAIFVISENCDRSNRDWKIAMRMVQEESLQRGLPCFFGIFLDYEPHTACSTDILEIRRRSYLDYPGLSQPANEQTFWSEVVEKISETGNKQVISMDLCQC